MTINKYRFYIACFAAVSAIASGCEQPKLGKPLSRSTDEAPAVEVEETVVAEVAPAETPSEPAATEPVTEADKTASNKVMLGSPELTSGIPGSGPLKLEEIKTWLANPKNHEVLEVELPLGLDAGISQVKGLEDNPMTRAKIELGRQLYFDPRLSGDTTISCASCHAPDEGYARHSRFGIGIRKQEGGRNSPPSYNRILSDLQFWDGRASSLEDQAKGPIQNPIEMGNTHEACLECVKSVPAYEIQFDKIFGKMNIDTIAQAIACFERALVTGPTPFDYHERFKPMESLDADDLKEDDPELYAKYEAALEAVNAHPMTDSAKRGRDIFFGAKGNCTACHVGANLTDEKYHNLGVGMDAEKPDIGREEVTKDPKDRGAFKTPTIRNVATSAPYMHDGSQKTLAEVVEWYSKGGHPNPTLSDKIKKLDLTDQDKADLVDFMEACTGDFPKVETKRLPE